MEQAVLQEIINVVVPGGGFTLAGPPQLKDALWTIPFHHYQFGLGQIFLPDRDVDSIPCRRALATELTERLGLAIASSQ